MNSPAASTSSSKSNGAFRFRLFCLLFLVIGAGVLYFATIRPAMAISAAAHWDQTPCTIDSSAVSKPSSLSHASPSTKVLITYHYTYKGAPYTSDRYDFSTGRNSLRAEQERIVAGLPPGKETACYVNPADPSQAVLSRKGSTDMAFGGVGAVFFLIGAVGLVFAPKVLSLSRN